MTMSIGIGFLVVLAGLLYLLNLCCKINNKVDIQYITIKKLKDTTSELENKLAFLSKKDIIEEYKELGKYAYGFRYKNLITSYTEFPPFYPVKEININDIEYEPYELTELKLRLHNKCCNKKKV